jgi:hypothetical protein
MTRDEQILRQALHAAAESVEPGADGLERIRTRLSRPRPLPIAWLMVNWASFVQPALIRAEPVLVRVGVWLRPALDLLTAASVRLQPVTRMLQAAGERLQPLTRMLRTEPSNHTSRYQWLRIAIAMGAVVLVAVVGGFALSGMSRQISQVAESVFPGQQHNSSGGGPNPGVSSDGQATPVQTGNPRPTPTPTPTCSPSKSGKKASNPSPSPSASVSPTPTPSSASPTASPTPTPSQASPTPSPSASSGDVSPTPSTGQVSDTDVILSADTLSSPSSKTKPSPTPSPSCSPAG